MTPAVSRSDPTVRSDRPLVPGRPSTPGQPLAGGCPVAAAASFGSPPPGGLGRLASHAAPGRTNDGYVGIPYCERCGTDEFVYLEAFIPAKRRHDGTVSRLGEASYFCSGCEDFSAHAVPASWVPPGWYLG